MNLLELGSDDLNLYFAGTMVKLLLTPKEESGYGIKNQWVSVKKFEPISSTQSAIIINSNPRAFRNDWVININRDKMFSPKLPHWGYFNYKASTVFLFRTNKRQNKKGIYNETTRSLFFLDQIKSFTKLPPEFVEAQKFTLVPKCMNLLSLEKGLNKTEYSLKIDSWNSV